MAFSGQKDFLHAQQPKIGVLITNLGTPEAPTTAALRRYLAQFLSDPRVVEVPRILWKCILHAIILRIRPRRSAAAYASIWTDKGSPLIVYTQQQRDALSQSLAAIYGEHIVVKFAMRYGNPSIAKTIDTMQKEGVRQLLVLPLYPQYSAATTASTFDALAKDFMQRRWLPALRFINHYHDYPAYIEALAHSIEEHWKWNGRADKLIISYHGVPLRYLQNGDPYHCECHKTSRLLAEYLGLSSDDYLTTFQSRFGRAEWLKPYTDETLKQLPNQGVKSVQVICPGFSADCLETIEEIGEENRGYFIGMGGERYEYIPALNASEEHISVLTSLIKKHLQGWDLPEDNAGTIADKYSKRLMVN
ncbi:ferrochelatase [Candidatus Endobugula sertula]|uniref:Ferrochelatase n=1 Tax=Candidatus Endobugula sertula TaxID=62101 RepID=A0A1D2QSS4_9GAMM|nr:ferrochelatase [Candidatus Endobugula sertula]